MNRMENFELYKSLVDDSDLYIKFIGSREWENMEFFVLLNIIHYDLFEEIKLNHFDGKSEMIVEKLDDNDIYILINNRVNNYSFMSNTNFSSSNKYVFSGYITYYLQNYNFLMATLILIFLIRFGNFKDDFLVRQHCNFILNQKRSDGKVGYINPLNRIDFDEKLFYIINDLCYSIIKKIYVEDKK